jgi:hypothetical protein
MIKMAREGFIQKAGSKTAVCCFKRLSSWANELLVLSTMHAYLDEEATLRVRQSLCAEAASRHLEVVAIRKSKGSRAIKRFVNWKLDDVFAHASAADTSTRARVKGMKCMHA